MKKLFSNVLLATALLMGGSALLSSCSDSGDGPDPTPTPDENQTAKYSVCTYYGEQKSKTGRYELMMSTSAVNDEGKPTEAGYQYIIQLYSTVAADPDNAVPAPGTYLYDAKNSFAVNTVSADGTKAWRYNESGNKTAVNFTDLSVVIAGQGVALTAEATITLSDGKKVLVKGKDFTFKNEMDESLIKGDVNLTGAAAIAGWLGTFELTSGGDPFSVYQVQLINGAQDAIMNLELYGPQAAKFANAALPIGKLPIVEIPSATLSAGKGFLEGNSLGGCYYATLTEGSLSFPLGLIESGSINISKSGENYTISVDCVSTNGYKITGSFTGPIQLQNMSGDSSLTEDKVMDLAAVTSGTADFWGNEMFNNVTTGCWLIAIDSKTAGGEAISMFINVASATSLTIPTGTFKADATAAADTFFPGSLQGNQIYPTSWIHYSPKGDGADGFAPLVDGTIKIETDGTKYTFTFDTVDDMENKVTGTWTGTLNVTDKRGTGTNSVHKLGTVNSTSLKLNTTNNRFTKVK